MQNIKVLVVGCGHMGSAYAHAYKKIDGFELIGLVSKDLKKAVRLKKDLHLPLPTFNNIEEGLSKLQPDAVSINTYPDTHCKFAIMAMKSGADVFTEKPLAPTLEEAQNTIKEAQKLGKKLYIGYILHHSPAYKRFIQLGQKLGRPLVMRMCLNQQLSGKTWNTCKNFMKSVSPIVDCGVHYVDVMCTITQAKPLRVHAIGANLTKELPKSTFNYGQMQIEFGDGSVGWYEVGWGPMISRSASSIKDIFGPKGSISMVKSRHPSDTADFWNNKVLLSHSPETNQKGEFITEDEEIDLANEPDWNQLCELQQRYFLKVIKEDIDLTDNHQCALNTLKIVLAADKSIQTKEVITLN
ncbi:MAG: Gfo/Idh/MocA family oxidoreductase [Fibrobacteria bacterium]|nr:Gfo/Idh/MocA family oxidoreductase [Fibrobacteria bacterium]